MVKIKDSSRSQSISKLPILKILQVITIAVIVCYIPFVIRGTGSATHDVVTNPERKTLSTENASAKDSKSHAAAPKDTSAATTTIGYAVSVTGCGSDPLVEGAAVLKHSIHLTSIHGNMGGKYDYKMYAIYHPEAASCSKPLAELGYELLERNTPIAVADIEGEFLRTKIENNGCCGEKELYVLHVCCGTLSSRLLLSWPSSCGGLSCSYLYSWILFFVQIYLFGCQKNQYVQRSLAW